MSLITTKDKYHVALNGIGLILQGAPDRLAYQMRQAPIYGQRFASGDRDYTDFSFWWYWAQTDFSGGIKHEELWEDDAKYFASEGVDSSEQPGSLVLAFALSDLGTYAKNTTWFDYGEAGGIGVLVGRNNTDQKMLITKATTLAGTVMWEDSATGANEKINCCDSFGGNSRLMLGCKTVGSGASTLKYSDGSTGADLAAASAVTAEIVAIVPYLDGDAAYCFTASSGIYKYARAADTLTQVSTAYPLAQASTQFSFGNLNGKGAWLNGDRIYFLGSADGYSHLYAYDITDNAYVRVFTFGRGYTTTRIIERNGGIYVFGVNARTSHVEVWKYVVSSGVIGLLHEIGRTGDTTTLISSPTKDASNIHFMIDDGTSDYEVWGIDNNDNLHASWSGSSNLASSATLLGCVMGGYLLIAKNGASGTNRFEIGHPAVNQNVRMDSGVLKTSVFDGGIPAIDKLFNSITLNFGLFTQSAQSITVEYSTDGGANFTSLGSASYTADGTSVTTKTLYFGSSVVARTLMLRFTLAGNGTATNNTPFLNAFSVQYIPALNVVKSWDLNINCGTEVKFLGGGNVEVPGRELRGMLTGSWLTKSLLDFQDIDYAESAINAGAGLSVSATTITVDSTADFPERGRLRIENEEITYTGKTPFTFTGCTRGARGTIAATHADNTVVSNAYRVIITDINERVPVNNDGKWLEYIMGLSIREA